MPYMKVIMTQKLTGKKAEALYKELGEAFEILPGKTRDFLILEVEDGKTLFFRGVMQKSFVFAQIHYAGNFAYNVKNKFTQAVFKAFENVLGISKEDASLTITEHQSWGSMGSLHDMLYTDEQG